MNEISNNAMSARDYMVSKREKGARDFLSKLPLYVIVNSTFLYGVDFKTASLDTIMGRICSLTEHIESLENLIAEYDTPTVKVLRISEKPTLPNEIYSDCDNKQDALRVILSNKDVLFLYKLYLAKMKQQEEQKEHSTRKPR